LVEKRVLKAQQDKGEVRFTAHFSPAEFSRSEKRMLKVRNILAQYERRGTMSEILG
jgi:hypothetical protein